MNFLPESATKVAQLLKQLGHDRDIVMLPETGKSSAEAAAGLGCAVAEIAKSIIFKRVSDQRMVMVIASGANRIDEHKVASIVGEIGKANAAFVREKSGYVIGGVCPIGHIEPGVILVDQDLLNFKTVWAAAGHPHAVFPLTPQQLLEYTAGTLADVKL